MPRVFLVTGTSSGFGNELVKQILSSGDTVVATARNPDKLSFENTTPKNYLAVALDVTDHDSIKTAFKKAVDTFGRLDVVVSASTPSQYNPFYLPDTLAKLDIQKQVNNAGYGLSGEFESLSDKQIRTQMEVNFFGLANVTRAALEQMRAQKPQGGLIQQVTSIGGQRGVPLFSSYCASKVREDERSQ